MKVTGIRTHLYECELARPLGDANLPEGFSTRADLATFVDTDAGLTGVAIGSPAIVPLVPRFEDLLKGRDPRSVRGLWNEMLRVAFKGGNEGAINAAISTLDCALWDLRAKASGVPLWKELGALEPRVAAYASGLDTPLSDGELHQYYAGMAALGVTAGKLKVGLDPEVDIRRIGIMHDALSGTAPRPAVMIDANEYWAPKQAIRRVREIEETYDLVWCEEPARRWDYRGLRKVSESIRAAVATGENLNAVSDYMPLVANEAVDVVQIGAGTSGITGALQVAELAYAFELPVAMMNCPAHHMAHLAAALPHHLMMEVVGAEADVPYRTDVRIEDGWIVLGNTPGNGIEYDEERLRAHAVSTPSANTIGGSYLRAPGAGVDEGLWRRSGTAR